MKRPQLYFKDEDAEMCYPISHHIEEADENELTNFTVMKAVLSKDKDYFWCREFGVLCESGQGTCGRACEGYKPRNGNSGVCTHHSRTHEHGEMVTYAKHHAHWVQVENEEENIWKA